mgnify:CR=1 FL=1
MVVKQSTSRENRFVACTYDGHIILFSIDESLDLKILEDNREFDGVYRYIRQIGMNKDVIAFISEQQHGDEGINKLVINGVETPGNYMFCDVIIDSNDVYAVKFE